MRGINFCTFGGNLAADPERRTVAIAGGTTTELLEFSVYVNTSASRDSKSFVVKVTCWKNSPSFNAATYLHKGSEVTVMGAISESPYISTTDNTARSGIRLNCSQLVLGRSPRMEESMPEVTSQPPIQETPPEAIKKSRTRKAKQPVATA